MADWIRGLIFYVLEFFGCLRSIYDRTFYTEIGVTGYVSDFERDVVKQRNLKPLNSFEKWLMKPFIEEEAAFRRKAFREAYIEVTGEDWEDLI